MSDWEVWICDQRGYRITPWEVFTKLSIVPAVNNVGAFVIEGGADSIDNRLLREDAIIEIDYTPPGGVQLVPAVGWLRKRRFYDDDGLDQVAVTCFNQNYLLTSRIVADYAALPQTTMTTYADDMLKEIVRDSLGADAIAGRNLTALGLTVAGNVSQGPAITKSFAWKKLLDTLQDIAATSAELGTRLYFDLVPQLSSTGGIGFDFRTYIGQLGQDRGSGSGNELVFSKERGSLVSPEFEEDWSEEVTLAYAGGQGDDSGRTVESWDDPARVGASVWNRREAFVSATNEDTATGVMGVAKKEVQNGRPVITFSGGIAEGKGCVYGKDWNLGYIAVAEYRGISYDVLINAIVVGINPSGERTITGKFAVLA